MLYVLRLTIMVLLSALPAIANDLEKSVQKTLNQAREATAGVRIPVNKDLEEGKKAAQESVSHFHSPEFQEKLHCEQQRIEEEVLSDNTINPVEWKAPLTGKLAKNERVYLFFSSSIPDETVHSYLAAVESLGNPGVNMLMRGFVPGERRYLNRITQKDLNCVDQLQHATSEVCERFEIPIKIQPSLFDKYEITLVPALIYENGDNAWKITGNARLDYLLEQINRATQSPGLGNLITTLQRGGHE